MKPLLISLALLCSLYGAFAQGVVNFRNENLPSPPDRLVRLDGCPTVGTTFAAQLLYGADPGSLTAHPTLAYFRTPTTSLPGTWLGANRTLNGVAAPAIPPAGGQTFGPQIWLQVLCWDSGPGRQMNFDQARTSGAAWGSSSIFAYQQRLSDPADSQDTAMRNFLGFQPLSGSCVPEPATALLLLPTIAVVWLLKRRTRHRKVGP